MKYSILTILIIICGIKCTSDKENVLLRTEILELQQEIGIISNELEGFELQGLSYTNIDVESKIDEFVDRRSKQATKVDILYEEFDETIEYETITCGDFESINCFVENWDVRKPDDGTVTITSDCTYNGTSSLRLSVPFIENEFNIPGMEIEGFVNGVEASTIYKVRFWMRYSGTSDLSNGPATYMIIIQDGDWLDYLYEGFHETNENKVFSKDWKLYSFQIATISNSPLEVIFGTNLDDVCIDDLHVVKKN